MSTRRYCAVFLSLVVFAKTNPGAEGQSLSWTPIATGVNYAVADGALGEDVFVGMGGLTTEQEWIDSWVGALYTASLHERGVRHLYSVKGPAVSHTEIGTLELARHLLLLIQSSPASNRIIVAGHSAGGAVARALFHDLYDGANVDSTHTTDGMISYFELDSGRYDPALTWAIADRLEHIYAVYAYLPSLSLSSSNAEKMIVLGEQFGSKSSRLVIDASESGCHASICLHMTMINQRPYQALSYDWRDYGAINAEHPVQTAYLDAITDITAAFISPWDVVTVTDANGPVTLPDIESMRIEFSENGSFSWFIDAVDPGSDTNLSGTYAVNEGTGTIVLQLTVPGISTPIPVAASYSFSGDDLVSLTVGSATAVILGPLFGTTFTGDVQLTLSRVAVGIVDALVVPASYHLSQNYPNPFNPNTTISYDLPRTAFATLTVYDVLGRTVRQLASGTIPAGTYEVTFDTTALASGVYFYRLQAGDYVETKRMVVVR